MRHTLTCGIGLLLSALTLAQPTAQGVAPAAQAAVVQPAPASIDPRGLPLVELSDLVLEGSFQLPTADGTGRPNTSFRYGVKAIGFHRERGTLFVSGEEKWMSVAEITVPVLKPSAAIAGLARAEVVQALEEPTEGRYKAIGDFDYARLGAFLPYKGKLYTNIYHTYDSNGQQAASLFTGSDDLSVKGDVQGPFKVGTLKTGYTSGYMGEVPAAWQALLGGPVLVGNCCISIISRTSFGPAAFVFDPADAGAAKPVPARPLVYYPPDHVLAPYNPAAQRLPNGSSPLFNGTTTITGVVFPEGTRSVLFFGRHGTGRFCYGIDCEDPLGKWQGNHAWPYQYQIWAYDATDLARVKAGSKKPWEVKPYGVWKLDLPFDFPNKTIKGAAYDPKTGRIFISQAQQDWQLIHVFKVAPK
jgi:hypothetical protein